MIVKKTLVESIPILPHLTVCLTGGGGKTTIMQDLAGQYAALGKTVLMTTTTKIQSPEIYNWKADYVFTSNTEIRQFVPSAPCAVVYAEKSEFPGKLVSPDIDFLENQGRKFDVVLIEADGSRHLPIKVHTQRDPVIPSFCDWTVCIAGSWAIGAKACSVTFGLPEIMNDRVVDIDFLDWYLTDSQGLLKNTKEDRRCIVITKSELLGKEFYDYFGKIKEKVILY